MDEFFKSLTSPVWWISVVVVGILVSVIAAYIKESIDKILSSIFKAWKLNVEQRKNKHIELVKKVQECDRTLFLLGFEESRFRQRSTLLAILSFMCLILVFQGQADTKYLKYLPYLNIYGGLAMLFAYSQLKKAIKIKGIMYTVKFNPRDYI
ncbi:hypothetical protein [Photobacterium kishitanii]|uniref:hypothetical protein n=1 Tax=Photobacterium kishitanii TaxID=318456 RepID=UPI0004321525|nr:hypothetical protein [Photobacterium kishitanii]CEO39091.1 membrane hypothetical protein [Photobacterium kishitanii]